MLTLRTAYYALGVVLSGVVLGLILVGFLVSDYGVNAVTVAAGGVPILILATTAVMSETDAKTAEEMRLAFFSQGAMVILIGLAVVSVGVLKALAYAPAAFLLLYIAFKGFFHTEPA